MTDDLKVLAKCYQFSPKSQPREGGNAFVFKGVDLTNDFRPVAIKILKYPNQPLVNRSIDIEISCLKRLQHPNIIKMHFAGTEPDTGKRYLVLEWADSDLLSRVSENPFIDWDQYYSEIGETLLETLRFAFQRQVIHRDLKPQNVLFDAEGTLKLADFGIGKLGDQIQPGLTLKGFKSIPYAPPEDDGGSEESRDVWGFAALSIRCLHDAEIKGYEDLEDALDSIAVTNEVKELLSRCISSDSNQRPRNIVELCQAVDSIRTKATGKKVQRRRCYLDFTSSATKFLCDEIAEADSNSAIQIALKDLQEAAAIKPWETDGDANVARYAIYSSRFTLRVRVHPATRDHLIVEGIWGANEPERSEMNLESNWIPTFIYKQGKPARSERDFSNMAEFLDLSIAEFNQSRSDSFGADESDRLLDLWESTLNARVEIERIREDPIKYSDYSVDGNTIRFSGVAEASTEIIDQDRYVETPSGYRVKGTVVWADDESLDLVCEQSAVQGMPKPGMLRVDTWLAELAIKRQRKALEHIRTGQCVQPNLRSLLASEFSSNPFEAEREIEVIQDDLDEHKRVALQKAISSQDFLALEGPPGTGKTKFITELIAQQYLRNPSSKILLVSQTHVALDNALERVAELIPEMNCVRVGRKHQVSKSVQPHLLDNQLSGWFSQSKSKSEAFLEEWASSRKIDKDDVELGIALNRFRTIQASRQSLQLKEGHLRKEIEELEFAEAELAEKESTKTIFQIREELQGKKEDEQDVRSEIGLLNSKFEKARDTLASLGEDGQHLAALSIEEQEEWERELLHSSPDQSNFYKLSELVEQWQFRFSRPKEFYPAILSDADLVAGTCIGFQAPAGIEKLEFDLCIIDEASKATPTESLVSMAQSRKWVLVGDEKQLPPYVEKALLKPEVLNEFGLSEDSLTETVFSRLLRDLPEQSKASLLTQYRMTKPIGDLVSDCFYDSKLESFETNWSEDLGLAGIPNPTTWISTSSLSSRYEHKKGTSFVNLAEADEIVNLLKRLEFVAKENGKQFSVAILVGYQAQREEITRRLSTLAPSLQSLTVACNTVDAFQGREADIAVYSVTRSNHDKLIGHLADRRRLNVALSRGRQKLVIVGDHEFCESAKGQNPFRGVLAHIRRSPGCEIRVLE